MNELMLPTNKKENQPGALVEVESNRAIQEVQAALAIAKRFPRDQMEAYTRIMKACERPTLAEKAEYAYPRGGTMITGPTIRLAETLAQNWGNIQFGIRELSQVNGCSEVEAFAWDIETNTRQVKVFTVPHVRYKKNSGNVPLKDPRDIYEMVANHSARRLRSCILGVIPGDITEAAQEACHKTLEKGDGRSLEDKIRSMITMFEKVGVDKEMIEARLQHKVTAIVPAQLIDLGKIYNSINDGMSKRRDWFEMPNNIQITNTDDLSEVLNGNGEKKTSNDVEKEETPPVSTRPEVVVHSAWLIDSYKNMRAGQFDPSKTSDTWTGFAKHVFENRGTWKDLQKSFKDAAVKKWDTLYPEIEFILDNDGDLKLPTTEKEEPPATEPQGDDDELVTKRAETAKAKVVFPEVFDDATNTLISYGAIRHAKIGSMTLHECIAVNTEMTRLIEAVDSQE